jgi:Ca2+/H+ antiporter
LRTQYAAVFFAVLGFAAASLPFFASRWALVFKRAATKPFLMYALESLFLFAFVVIAFLVWESRQGQRAAQDWEYYAVMICLWLVAAFPGFVWRFLLRHRATLDEAQADHET